MIASKTDIMNRMGLAPFDCQHTHGENGAERANKARAPPTFKQLFPNEDHNYLRTPSEHLGVMRINLNCYCISDTDGINNRMWTRRAVVLGRRKRRPIHVSHFAFPLQSFACRSHVPSSSYRSMFRLLVGCPITIYHRHPYPNLCREMRLKMRSTRSSFQLNNLMIE